MKAIQISEYGDTSVIQINEIDKPVPTEDQVLVEVHASSLNPFDTMVRMGYVKDAIASLPVTLGGDIAATIAEVGANVKDFAIGDKVYGQANAVAGNSGAFAEFAATKASQIAKAPFNLNFEESASLPLVGVSALQALSEHLELQSGQKLFINGFGGIGSIAMQIAKNLGAYVAVTATGDGLDQAKQLGADEVVDYKTQDYTEVLRDFDAVFDTVGQGFDKTLNILRKGGKAVSMIAQADESRVDELGVSAVTQSTHVTTAKLNELRELVESGVVKPRIGKTFPLDQAKEAFDTREAGETNGKIVLKVT